MKINERWEKLREESHANIQSEKGILKRQIRSIQTEGHFGDIKENKGFLRPKISRAKRKERIPRSFKGLKRPEVNGILSFLGIRG